MDMIAFDVDGVLANFTRGFTRVGNRLFGTPIADIPAQRSWMFEDSPELSLDKAQCKIIWDVILKSPCFWRDLDPVNVSVMQRIDRIRNKVFITNRFGQNPQQQTVDFLTKWGISSPEVIMAKDKSAVCAERNVVAIIDDFTDNVKLLRESNPNMYVALLDVPYNRWYHEEWQGEIVISADQFIDVCDRRGLTEY